MENTASFSGFPTPSPAQCDISPPHHMWHIIHGTYSLQLRNNPQKPTSGEESLHSNNNNNNNNNEKA
jgi:hypothetical protein